MAQAPDLSIDDKGWFDAFSYSYVVPENVSEQHPPYVRIHHPRGIGGRDSTFEAWLKPDGTPDPDHVYVVEKGARGAKVDPRDPFTLPDLCDKALSWYATDPKLQEFRQSVTDAEAKRRATTPLERAAAIPVPANLPVAAKPHDFSWLADAKQFDNVRETDLGIEFRFKEEKVPLGEKAFAEKIGENLKTAIANSDTAKILNVVGAGNPIMMQVWLDPADKNKRQTLDNALAAVRAEYSKLQPPSPPAEWVASASPVKVEASREESPQPRGEVLHNKNYDRGTPDVAFPSAAPRPAAPQPDIRQTALADLARFGIGYLKSEARKYVQPGTGKALLDLASDVLAGAKAAAPAAEAPARKPAEPISVTRNDGVVAASGAKDFQLAPDVIAYEAELAKRETERVAEVAVAAARAHEKPVFDQVLHDRPNLDAVMHNPVAGKPTAINFAEAIVPKPNADRRHHYHRHYHMPPAHVPHTRIADGTHASGKRHMAAKGPSKLARHFDPHGFG